MAPSSGYETAPTTPMRPDCISPVSTPPLSPNHSIQDVLPPLVTQPVKTPEAVSTVLFNPNLLKQILENVYDAPTDYGKASHLIPYEGNSETNSIKQLFALQWVCRDWYYFIKSLNIIPFAHPRGGVEAGVAKNGGRSHRLHIPFLTWLGSKMKQEAHLSLTPKTKFAKISDLVKEAKVPRDGFSPTDFISSPPVSDIWIRFQTGRHPIFTKYYQRNPDPKKRKAVCCPIGKRIHFWEFSHPVSESPNNVMVEDAFVLHNPYGVTVSDITDFILGILAGYYSVKHTYMLWNVEVGFPTGRKEKLSRLEDIIERLKLSLFENSDRSAKIFLADHRLDMTNKDRVTCQTPTELDTLHGPKKTKPTNGPKEKPAKLSINGSKDRNKKTGAVRHEKEKKPPVRPKGGRSRGEGKKTRGKGK
ncbi:hypothetical protein TWF718_003408 [Orbilia javanica]|uniref:Uncharacterized protein n=1 Tax=Orbilia javanica TaxID=47235 RepID=A0AAN8RA31_9PEZI